MTLALILSASIVGVLLGSACRHLSPNARGVGDGSRRREMPLSPASPVDAARLRLTASGLVWLNPQTGSLMAFSGPQGRGAARRARDRKHAEADERNARTLPENRRAARRPA